MKSEIYLIGAGFGSADLLTVKSVKILKKSDVILYDALVNEDVLKYCNPAAEKVFVGKRKGLHHKSQAETNLLLLQYARKGGIVTRLKGGDPFVFGRGYEEISFLNQFDFNVEVVPGISSSYGLASMHQYCLTAKDLSDSFWVVTGHTKSNEISADLHLAAQSDATVVVLMGMENLENILYTFKKYRPHQTFAIIISKGGTKEETIVEGDLNSIFQFYQERKIENPAILMVGESLMAAKEQYFEKALALKC